MAALLCRRLLLADTHVLRRIAPATSLLAPPTQNRIAAASPPTLQPTSPGSTPSASPATRPAASVTSRTAPLPCLPTPAASISMRASRTAPLPSPPTPAASISMRASAGAVRARIPRSPPSTSASLLLQGSQPYPLLLSRRTFSDHNLNPSQLPPITQLAFRDDGQASEEGWVELTQYLEHRSLVQDARQNHLNMEIAGFGERPRYNLSEHTGIPLFESLVLLALANCNRGFCVKDSFYKANLLVSPRLNQIKFKTVICVDLESGVSDKNRAACYAAVARLIRELLIDNVGANVIKEMLPEPRDLLSKLERPSDERLIIYHPAFLSTDGRLWYYKKLYTLIFKIFPLDDKLNKKSKIAVSDFAYTDGNLLIFDIIKSHPLLAHIEGASQDDTERSDETEGPEGKSDKHGPKGKVEMHKKKDLGKKVVALHRHTIEHAFDHDARRIQSNQRPHMSLWPYSIHQVVDFLKSVMPLHLLKSQENFVGTILWPYLNIDGFWSRDLTWIGGVPAPSEEEEKAIQKEVSYGKRRLQSRKYD